MSKIISKQTADKLVRRGAARIEGVMYDAQSDTSYAIVTRLDQQRTDHCRVGCGDMRDTDPHAQHRADACDAAQAA